MENLVIQSTRLFCLRYPIIMSLFYGASFFNKVNVYLSSYTKILLHSLVQHVDSTKAQTAKFVGDPRRSRCDAHRVSVALT